MSYPIFYPNDTKTAWIKKDPNIKTQQDFYNLSPYSSSGPRASRKIFRRELGDRFANNPKKYHSDKDYIVSRIAYNQDNPNPIPQKYDQVASQYESFLKADGIFGGSGRFLGSNNPNINPNPNLNINYNPQQQFNTSSQLTLTDEEFKKKMLNQNQDHTSRVRPVKLTNKYKTRQLTSHQESHFGKLTGIDNDTKRQEDFVNYPNTNIYFKCPVNFDFKELTERLKGKFKQPLGADLKRFNKKRIYCGNDLNLDLFIKAKMCGLLSQQELEKIYEEFPELKNLQELGSQGQCFNYGKYRNIWKDQFQDYIA